MTTENVTRSFSSFWAVFALVCAIHPSPDQIIIIMVSFFNDFVLYWCVHKSPLSYHLLVCRLVLLLFDFWIFISITSSFAWINIWQIHTRKQQLHKANRMNAMERAGEKTNWNMKMRSRANECSDSNDSLKQLINFDKLDTKKRTRNTLTHTKPNKPYYSEWKCVCERIYRSIFTKAKKSGKTQIQLLFLTISIIHFFIGY